MIREKLVDLKIVTVPHMEHPDEAHRALQTNLLEIIRGEEPDGC
jgi:hypothetical protein